MLSHLMNHIHFTYELCNTHIYSIVFKIILTRRVLTVDPIIILVTQKLVALKGSYNCVIAQFIVHNSIHTSHLNTHVFHHPSHVQFITYSQFESSFHNLNITIYTKDFITTWGVKSLKQFLTIISKSINQIHGLNTKTSRALKFINQFSSGHQLVHRTQ